MENLHGSIFEPIRSSSILHVFGDFFCFMTNPDSPAFAAGAENRNQAGLTTREYFAALAMQGLLSNSDVGIHLLPDDELAAMAIGFADATIKALNQTVKS